LRLSDKRSDVVAADACGYIPNRCSIRPSRSMISGVRAMAFRALTHRPGSVPEGGGKVE
jgi:hypothetical protein